MVRFLRLCYGGQGLERVMVKLNANKLKATLLYV